MTNSYSWYRSTTFSYDPALLIRDSYRRQLFRQITSLLKSRVGRGIRGEVQAVGTVAWISSGRLIDDGLLCCRKGFRPGWSRDCWVVAGNVCPDMGMYNIGFVQLNCMYMLMCLFYSGEPRVSRDGCGWPCIGLRFCVDLRRSESGTEPFKFSAFSKEFLEGVSREIWPPDIFWDIRSQCRLG